MKRRRKPIIFRETKPSKPVSGLPKFILKNLEKNS